MNQNPYAPLDVDESADVIPDEPVSPYAWAWDERLVFDATKKLDPVCVRTNESTGTVGYSDCCLTKVQTRQFLWSCLFPGGILMVVVLMFVGKFGTWYTVPISRKEFGKILTLAIVPGSVWFVGGLIAITSLLRSEWMVVPLGLVASWLAGYWLIVIDRRLFDPISAPPDLVALSNVHDDYLANLPPAPEDVARRLEGNLMDD